MTVTQRRRTANSTAMRWAEQEARMAYGIGLDVLPKNWHVPITGTKAIEGFSSAECPSGGGGLA